MSSTHQVPGGATPRGPDENVNAQSRTTPTGPAPTQDKDELPRTFVELIGYIARILAGTLGDTKKVWHALVLFIIPLVVIMAFASGKTLTFGASFTMNAGVATAAAAGLVLSGSGAIALWKRRRREVRLLPAPSKCACKESHDPVEKKGGDNNEDSEH